MTSGLIMVKRKRKMKSDPIFTVCTAFLLFSVTCGWSHGTIGHVALSQGHMITAEYDDGEPMGYAAVEIKGPGSDIAFQTGHTDRNGRFMFFPDREGRWQIVVQDGMGHRVSLVSDVSGEKPGTKDTDESSHSKAPGMTRAQKAVMGISIIFGIFGLWYGWKGRHSHN
ncbi:conserved hypothetical protein [uncultured Desulfobacterium sp.]|uniref:Nickel transport protein n=1 Tax=uncultured Desulfobacterium sp. TaxID=201089 RepID=A0A445MTY3_9BACT|nr:conserved hypothetical protein [uncultured Desulfobacterium sp.]